MCVCVLAAIDVTVNILQSLEMIVSLGCDRVLTSGGEGTALEGTPMIRKMIEYTVGRIIVMPGTSRRCCTSVLYTGPYLSLSLVCRKKFGRLH